MAAIFQIRRGTTDISSSIFDGELYLNKSKNSLQVSIGDGNPITLVPLNTASAGDIHLHGNITASNANFTGDVKIDGNLYLGNQSTDNISALGQFTTNLVPNPTNTIDVGTTSAVWANVYANNVSASSFTGSFSGSVQGINITTFSQSVDNRLDQLEVNSGSQDGRITTLESKATTLQTYTASVDSRLNQLSTDSGSQNIRITTLESKATTLQTYTASVDSKLSALETDSGSQNTRITTLETKATTLETYTSSVDSRLNQLSTDSGSQNGRLNNLESTSASLLIETSNLELFTQSINNAIDVTGGNTRIKGNLIVDGTQTLLNTTETFIEDKSITLASGSTTSGMADGAGFNIAGANVSMSWQDSNTRLFFNTNIAALGSISSSTIVGLNGVSVSSYSASVDSRLTNLQTTSGSLNISVAALNTFSASQIQKDSTLQTYTSSLDNTVARLREATASLNTFTASASIRLNNLETTSASLLIETSNLELFSSSALLRLSALETDTGSQNTRIGSLESRATTLQTYTASVNSRLDQLSTDSGSQNGRITVLETKATTIEPLTSSILAFTQSAGNRLTKLEESTASLNTFTGSTYPIFSQSVDLRLDDLEYTASISIGAGLTTALGQINAFTQSANSRLNNLESKSASVDISVSNLNTFTSSTFVTFSSSVDSRLDLLETSTGSDNSRITVLETKATTLASVTSSLLIETANLESFSSSALTRLSALEVETANLESFTSSINTTIKSKLDADGVISSSAQLTTTFDSRYLNTGGDGVVSGSSQITYNGLSGIPANIISASTDSSTVDFTITGGTITANLIGGVVSGSSQITAGSTTNFATDVKTQLNSNTVVSGSSQITLSSTTGGGTSANVQFGSFGVGTAASGVSGEIRAAGDITAFYSSDSRLKYGVTPIQNALEKVESISGNTYHWKEGFEEIHSNKGKDVGVIAQEIQNILPEIVTERDSGYLAVNYEKLVPLLIEAIKELSQKVKVLENK